MLSASQIRAGMAIRYEGQSYKVISADYHPGQGKMGGVLHARLKNLATGTFWEHSFRAELKLEEIQVDKRALEFLYTDGAEIHFMDPDSYEQFPLPSALVGEAARLLGPGMKVSVEFVEDRATAVQFPDTMEVRVAATAPPVHSQVDSTWKPATLESGIEVMVPQFIKTGDVIRLDVMQLKYMDRARSAGK